ncbi:MAG: energy-coupling factor transporter ATPase [Eubacteriales bacterium]|nr:energy-coupling factor transporter ATPase [Clostridiales bacterium]MDY5836219.1 energy-coupling factor transporter ATPase [Eubacteriales bacterium]
MTNLSKDMVCFTDVSFAYQSDQQEIRAIEDLSLAVRRGQHVAIIGHNGSGKSTFARLCNALILPDQGQVSIAGLTASSMEAVYEIRRTCGMVFQNPDDQIVASSLEEDVAFGPENLGLSTTEIQSRVQDALARVGLTPYAKMSPQHLSGGQKQKLSVAGVLAMHPTCLVLDESTSMLDPQAAQDLMDFVTELCRTEGLTLINITHNMEEAMRADQVFVLSRGKLVLSGSPREIFAQPDRLTQENLVLPFYLGLYHELLPWVPALAYPETAEDLANNLADLIKLMDTGKLSSLGKEGLLVDQEPSASPTQESFIEIKDLSYSYNPKSSRPQQVLHEINLQIRQGEIFVLCGHSGSGKSTLISHLNGIYRAQTGWVKVLGYDSRVKEDLIKIRQLVGLVFQYPEKQLFAETVAEDIAFGLRQQKLAEEEISARIREVAELLDLDPDLLDRSPFELSGGQQRRVAIAGVLAMQPEVLVLDEPAAGLDPLARQAMLDEIKALNRKGKTIVMVTHNMEDAAYLADRIAVMAQGRILAIDKPEIIFSQADLLAQSGLALPASLRFSHNLSQASGLDLNFMSLQEASSQLQSALALGNEGLEEA